MKFKYIYFIPIGFVFFFLTGFAFASSAQYLSQAQKFINTTCSRPRVDDLSTVLCYIFNKVQEQDTRLANHETRIANLEATITPVPGEIADLQKRVSVLEKQIPQPSPAPKTFTFFNGSINANGQTSPTFDTQGGYSKILVSFQCTVGSVPVDIQASTDQNTWVSQENWDASYCQGGIETQLVLAGRYYRLVTGTTNSPSVTLNATGYIFHQ